VLLELRPKALSKAELHERLWPETFVSDANLAALIAEVRSALGDPGRDGRFIRTVHGFGYAFAGEATTAGTAPPEAGISCWLSWGDREYALKPGDQTIGRDRTADVRIDTLSISRVHARLTWHEHDVSIEDLGSKNGTWVRGKRVAGAVGLQDGDEVRLGDVRLTFRNLNAPGSTKTVDV
jgi:DNA-binding winged helix-turn-helix (wHTH) protein